MPLVSSALKTISIRQSPAPMLIGERINAQGSKKAKEMILKDDYDGLVDLARRQTEAGAHCLDVSVAVTERDNEREFMTNLVRRISAEVEAPLVIDSTEPAVVESAVRQIPGLPIINSINLEGDGSRFVGMAPIMAKYGVPAVAMCIGPDGMAKTAQEKMRVAEMIIKNGREYGLSVDQYIFDPLTFTLATGQEDLLDSGVQTIEGIRLIKEMFPDAHTVIGLSNISFGLEPYPRRVINSVFLYHAVRAGLDCVILNPAHTTPYHAIPADQRTAAEDLIFNRKANALASLLSNPAMSKSNSTTGSTREPVIDPHWPASKRAAFHIINRIPDGLEQDVIRAIADNIRDPVMSEDGTSISMSPEETHDAAIAVLNKSLLPAMKTVGDRFGAGELILPYVLKSAECMKAAVSELEKYLVRKEGASKGRVVLGTVYGDVHDIGKNLVKTIFQNNGYTVYDLGKQVPMQTFLDKIEEVGADAVGLSALLVNTSREMKRFVDHARDNNMDIPILCGGAAINSNYIERIATDNGTYKSGAFYCKDIFAGLNTMDRLMSDREGLLAEWYTSVGRESRVVPAARVDAIPRSAIRPVAPPDVKLGTTIIHDIDYDTVWGALNEKAVILRGWGVHGRSAGKWKKEHERLFSEMKETVRDILEPRIIYGFFKCSSSGESLKVRGDSGTVIFDFPRSLKSRHLCISDYFGDDDIVAFQACTAGEAANTMVTEWSEVGRTTDAFYLNGFVTEFVEALAEWTSRIIKDRMGPKYRCLRYSWGYPDCPDVTQHRLVWDVLRPERIGMKITTSGHISPDLSTVAIVVGHPDAKYSG